MGKPSQSYGTSPAMWDHTVFLPLDTAERAPRYSQQVGRYSIYLP